MVNLGNNWFAEGNIDFEYKKYLLLAYLQHVNEDFKENKLYPALAELVGHYRSLTLFMENKRKMYNSFPQEISEVDLKNFRLVYEKTVQDEPLMEEIEHIVTYSLPKLKRSLDNGKERYDDVESHLNLWPVGLLPMYKNEGYLLLRNGQRADTAVFEYRITIFDGADEKYRAVHTAYVSTYTYGIINTSENIKKDLLKSNRKMPNPATYAIDSEINYPMEETLLPIARRLLVRSVS